MFPRETLRSDYLEGIAAAMYSFALATLLKLSVRLEDMVVSTRLPLRNGWQRRTQPIHDADAGNCFYRRRRAIAVVVVLERRGLMFLNVIEHD
ncbi:MAG: hypothetical protein U0528_11045 [Anaerolineae bacterium]